MGALAVIYSVCFIVLCSAAVFFLRRSSLPGAVKEPRGLVCEPRYNEENNTVSIKNNFSEYCFGLGTAMRGNYSLRVLRRVCADAEEGKNYGGALYLSLYKKYHDRFWGVLCAASHVAPLASLAFSGGGQAILAPLAALQFILYAALSVIRYILNRNIEAFTELLYQNWYGRLLDAGAMRDLALKNTLLEQSVPAAVEELRGIVSELKDTCAAQSGALADSNRELSARLRELSREKEAGNIVSVESVAGALELTSRRVQEFCQPLEAAAKTLETISRDMPLLNAARVPDINAIQNLAGEFFELRKTLSTHTSAAETAAIEKLNAISETLETEVRQTWAAIHEAMSENAKELSASYERFFELCKTISAAAEERKANND